MILRTTMSIASIATGLLSATLAYAQAERPSRPPRQPVSAYPTPTAWPNQDKAAVIETLSRARKIAGDDLFGDFTQRCIMSPGFRTRVAGIQFQGLVEPTKIFDNLYAVGQNSVSSHALVTSAGIVLFDTLNSPEEAKEIIVPNLIKVGLDPKNIKYIVITHAHGDHYGGARYLQDTYGARVIASAIDWDAMYKASEIGNGPFAGLVAPKRDIVVTDGQDFKVGDTDLHFYVTPGHTWGVLSTIFKVTDHGTPHVVGYFGGTGGGGQPDNLRAQIVSLGRWQTLTKAAGADVLIANHPLHDHAIENNEILRYLKPGDANPYVLGTSTYQRYFRLQQECTRVYLARYGFTK